MSKVEVFYILEMELITTVWYPEKHTLIEGPSFPSSFQDLYANSFCSISLNKTHLIIMGHQMQYYNYNVYRYKVTIIDFPKARMVHLTNFDLDFFMHTCRGALGFEKHGKRFVIHPYDQNFYLLNKTCLNLNIAFLFNEYFPLEKGI